MKTRNINSRARLGTALAALAIGLAAVAAPAPAMRPAAGLTPRAPIARSTQVLLSVGEGQMVNLPRSVASVWTSNPKVADVYVNSPHQMNLFGKDFGEATVIATAADGSVVYGAKSRSARTSARSTRCCTRRCRTPTFACTTVGQIAVLNGTVASPEDAAFAPSCWSSASSTRASTSRKDGATCKICVGQPSQGRNSAAGDAEGADRRGEPRLAQADRRQPARRRQRPAASSSASARAVRARSVAARRRSPLPGSPRVVQHRWRRNDAWGCRASCSASTCSARSISRETDGLVTTLAEPTLTALSGETASFLAGGEFPIPVSQSLGAVTIEYKQYGVGLAFTPVVLADGRISMRVRPEVSELSDAGSVNARTATTFRR